MSGNYPPGTGPGDPNAPWNAPDPADLLPLDCEECGFRAETLQEMEDHEHAADAFTRPEPEPSRTWDDVKEDPTPSEAERYDLEPGPPEVPPDALDDEDE